MHLLPNDKIREGLVVHLCERIDGMLPPREKIGRVLRAWSLPCKILFTVWETCRNNGNMGVGHDLLAVRMKNTVRCREGIVIEENTRTSTVVRVRCRGDLADVSVDKTSKWRLLEGVV